MADSSGTASNEILDVTGMKSPDNVLAVLKKVTELPKGSILEVRLDSNPFQLYDLLQQRGYFLDIAPQSDGTYLGKVRQRENGASAQ